MDTMFALTNLISISLVSIILALVRISILQKRIVCLVMLAEKMESPFSADPFRRRWAPENSLKSVTQTPGHGLFTCAKEREAWR